MLGDVDEGGDWRSVKREVRWEEEGEDGFEEGDERAEEAGEVVEEAIRLEETESKILGLAGRTACEILREMVDSAEGEIGAERRENGG